MWRCAQKWKSPRRLPGTRSLPQLDLLDREFLRHSVLEMHLAVGLLYETEKDVVAGSEVGREILAHALYLAGDTANRIRGRRTLRLTCQRLLHPRTHVLHRL